MWVLELMSVGPFISAAAAVVAAGMWVDRYLAAAADMGEAGRFTAVAVAVGTWVDRCLAAADMAVAVVVAVVVGTARPDSSYRF